MELYNSKRSLKLAFVMLMLFWGHLAAQADDALPPPKGPVILTITGLVERTNAAGESQFDQSMLEQFDKVSFTTSHVFADEEQTFEGISLRSVLERVGAKGKMITARALNLYEVTIPFEDLDYGPILAMKVNGRPLTLRDKGPLWIVYPRDKFKQIQSIVHDSRWVWQLSELHVD